MSSRTLLIEIGCEELPSSSLRQLGEGLLDVVTAKLAAQGLEHGEARWFAAPRRLAVRIDALREQAPDQEREALGPPVAQARDEDGNWTRAAEGFAKKQGVSPDALQVIDTPKGERLGLVQTVAGARTSDVLPTLLAEAITELPVAKRMRWGASRLEFARPIHWLVLMYGAQADFGDVLGLPTGNSSRGHRFHAPQAVRFETADAYEATLRDARVIADFAERCELIRGQVEKVAASLGAQALIDEDLLEEVASLVEWPVALAGSFDAEFLEVPAEALISSMQSHQKYFPVVDAHGALLPHFITVSNVVSRDPAQVIAGNEKVIRPRLADAAFFYEQDRQHTLASRVPRLADVVFQTRLGSLGERAARIARLAAQLAPHTGADAAQAQRAGELCKADLVSDMVLEFADMQGIAGAYYARNDGEAEEVATAIAQHYWPLQAGSALPESPVAAAVALADRLDILVGIFGIGQPPSGSRDPFALRRASIAVLRIMIEKGLDLDLRDCLEEAAAGYPDGVLAEDTVGTVLDYMFDRLPALYEEQGVSIDMFRAVRGSGCTEPGDFDRRLRAVRDFCARPEAEALAAANKRVSNILAKSDAGEPSEVSADLLVEGAEKTLAAAIDQAAAENRADLERADYTAALTRLAGLREPVDAFFDDVMVNAEDPALRANRLALLAQLRGQFLAIADISRLAA
jgi:glycyl-tRNA synthetase beta chain